MPYMRNTLTQAVLGPMANDSPEYEYLRGLTNGNFALYEEVPFVDSGLAAAKDVRSIQAMVPAAAAGADTTQVIGLAPYAGKVTAVEYIPDAAVVGANTNTRTLAVVNGGQAGAGSTSVASLALASGTNLTSEAQNAITLSGTPSHLVVAANDELVWNSTHAASGLADPGGLVIISFTRD